MDYKNIYNKTDVVQLKYSDFTNKKINNSNFDKKNGLIIFYAPWCTHCKEMRENISNISTIFKNKFIIGSVNIEDTKNSNDFLLALFNIRRYPTIKFVNKTGKLTKYEGSFDYDDFIYFIWNKL